MSSFCILNAMLNFRVAVVSPTLHRELAQKKDCSRSRVVRSTKYIASGVYIIYTICTKLYTQQQQQCRNIELIDFLCLAEHGQRSERGRTGHIYELYPASSSCRLRFRERLDKPSNKTESAYIYIYYACHGINHGNLKFGIWRVWFLRSPVLIYLRAR